MVSFIALCDHLHMQGVTIAWVGDLQFVTSDNRRYYRSNVYLGPKLGRAWKQDLNYGSN